MPQPQPQTRGAGGSRGALRWMLQNVVWLWLVGLIVIFGVLNNFFFTVANLQNILIQATVLGLLALAVSLPLLVAEIDLSIASNMGFSSVVGAMLLSGTHLPWWLGMLIGIAAGALIGLFNGLCITRLRMVSLIETLAMMIILQGALLAITHGNTITDMPMAYDWIGQANVLGWPVMPIIFALALIAVAVVLRATVFGRSVYAVGGNALAAATAGIRVNRIKILAFTASGFLSAVAGYLLAAWQMAITSNQGAGFLLYAIAAPIIGGVSVFGGRGRVIGILGGVLLLTVIHVGLSIVNVPSFYVDMIGGLAIFVAVAIDAMRVRLSAGAA
ncbi:MAG: ABC transporter permease [Proteobacteria bacterium]|nr:ABC transporter permease [Pseudomonadota bacterium]